MQGVLSSGARVSVSEVGQQNQKKCSSCKGFCHQSVGEVNDSCKSICHLVQEVLSPARGSVSIWCKSICHASGPVMQEVLGSYARGSVSCKSICHASGSMSNLLQEYLSHARGSVYLVQGYCHLTQEDLSPARVSVMQEVPSYARVSVSCKSICLCKGFCHPRVSVMQEVLSLE